jgi:hypothetical protein
MQIRGEARSRSGSRQEQPGQRKVRVRAFTLRVDSAVARAWHAPGELRVDAGSAHAAGFARRDSGFRIAPRALRVRTPAAPMSSGATRWSLSCVAVGGKRHSAASTGRRSWWASLSDRTRTSRLVAAARLSHPPGDPIISLLSSAAPAPERDEPRLRAGRRLPVRPGHATLPCRWSDDRPPQLAANP